MRLSLPHLQPPWYSGEILWRLEIDQAMHFIVYADETKLRIAFHYLLLETLLSNCVCDILLS